MHIGFGDGHGYGSPNRKKPVQHQEVDCFFQAEDGIRDWSVTGVQTCALPISTRRSRATTYISRLFIRAWRKWSRVTDVLSDTIPGIRVVKAFNQEDREIDRFGERNEEDRKSVV